MQVKRECKNCGREFKARQSPSRGTRGQFCSRECYYQYLEKTTHIRKICPECGKEFVVPRWCERQRFCSVACGARYSSRISIKPRPTSKPNKRMRNQGERTTKDGRRLRLPRYLMEQKLGRKLKTEETVHHKDMDICNNPIDCSNYHLYPNQAKHMKGHRSLDKLIPELLGQAIIEFVDGKYVMGKGTRRKS